MRRVDPLDPGRRVADPQARGRGGASWREAFNDMLDRLEAERQGSARRALAAHGGASGCASPASCTTRSGRR